MPRLQRKGGAPKAVPVRQSRDSSESKLPVIVPGSILKQQQWLIAARKRLIMMMVDRQMMMVMMDGQVMMQGGASKAMPVRQSRDSSESKLPAFIASCLLRHLPLATGPRTTHAPLHSHGQLMSESKNEMNENEYEIENENDNEMSESKNEMNENEYEIENENENEMSERKNEMSENENEMSENEKNGEERAERRTKTSSFTP
jgi:hypothetical protein